MIYTCSHIEHHESNYKDRPQWQGYYVSYITDKTLRCCYFCTSQIVKLWGLDFKRIMENKDFEEYDE
jgi:hypothetical protein